MFVLVRINMVNAGIVEFVGGRKRRQWHTLNTKRIVMYTYIILNEQEINVSIDYTCYKAIRGQRDSYGVSLEPDEPASIEINQIETEDGKFIDFDSLSEHEQKRIREEISDNEQLMKYYYEENY